MWGYLVWRERFLRRLDEAGKRASQSGMKFQEGDWYRPALLKIFAEGRELLENGDLETADAFFERVVLRAPYFAPARYLRGRARFEQGRTSEACREFQEAQRLDPERPEYHRWAALALERLGMKKEAVDQLREALRKDADYPEARLALERLQALP